MVKENVNGAWQRKMLTCSYKIKVTACKIQYLEYWTVVYLSVILVIGNKISAGTTVYEIPLYKRYSQNLFCWHFLITTNKINSF